MKHIQIIRNGIITNGMSGTPEEINEYLVRETANGSFGKPEHQLELKDENGDSFDPPQFETIPSEFEVEILDITAEVEQAAINEAALKFLNDSDFKVLRHRDQMDLGISTSLSEEEYQELLSARQDARLRIVRE